MTSFLRMSNFGFGDSSTSDEDDNAREVHQTYGRRPLKANSRPPPVVPPKSRVATPAISRRKSLYCPEASYLEEVEDEEVKRGHLHSINKAKDSKAKQESVKSQVVPVKAKVPREYSADVKTKRARTEKELDVEKAKRPPRREHVSKGHACQERGSPERFRRARKAIRDDSDLESPAKEVKKTKSGRRTTSPKEVVEMLGENDGESSSPLTKKYAVSKKKFKFFKNKDPEVVRSPEPARHVPTPLSKTEPRHPFPKVIGEKRGRLRDKKVRPYYGEDSSEITCEPTSGIEGEAEGRAAKVITPHENNHVPFLSAGGDKTFKTSSNSARHSASTMNALEASEILRDASSNVMTSRALNSLSPMGHADSDKENMRPLAESSRNSPEGGKKNVAQPVQKDDVNLDVPSADVSTPKSHLKATPHPNAGKRKLELRGIREIPVPLRSSGDHEPPPEKKRNCRCDLFDSLVRDIVRQEMRQFAKSLYESFN